MNIRCILFDLGGVLFNIDHAKTRVSLHELQLPTSMPLQFSLEHAEQVFGDFDAGLIDTKEFIERLRIEHDIRGSDDRIIQAWNAMLLGLYPDSLTFISALSQSMNIALLSNINPIHHDAVSQECSPLFSSFHHVFLSYQLRKKKPDIEIFSHVIRETGCSAQEILFLDDTPVNCAIAQSLGMHIRNVNPRSREWVKDIQSQFL